jgi:hypothetical protein
METENYVQMMTDSLIMKKDILEKVIVLSTKWYIGCSRI